MKLVGVGIDLCKLSRIQHLLDSPASQNFLRRTLHPDELSHEITSEYVGSRWAVKEAFVKAVGQPLIFSEVKVSKSEAGRPILEWSGSTLTKLASYGSLQAHVSISHETDYAVAVVVLMSSLS
mmetsp:Transcript_9633/g.18786  ORF Transcript_9633/g.18786 Transcript_9633/m.18786 type:complete len:123 (+) Transcript_9633:33-401(+)